MAVVSSCREMLGLVPQRAQPSFLVASIKLGTLGRLPVINRRKVGMTSSQHAPYVLGYTRTTMLRTKGRKHANASKSHKPWLSSDCRLQLACMKLESLVIAGQHYCGEYVPGPCTHRPSHHGSWFSPKSLP